ncbi:flagellar biosynthesis protein FlgM [Leptolyngbyaceae cyanobacterium CCMR0082]|uniref:Flagellar biosynthesis protein FlgM n=1 Tax=Adonisia turfae CCMR0082 TaxID=2304604 RepID=A0A6M0SCK3_9CYAN|nr:neutral zinc metallopeptidase [Adonisia turfae]MDV3351343.1 neutral zinc metallopeptidase [Leptothoe sp. LEGE 181152]NEZ66225.1 flagellar biosynthesis protein FlgM [Adonisia turfae CCMR0082]
MKKTGRRSSNIDDRRGATSSLVVGGGGLGALVLAAVVTLVTGDPGPVLDQVAQTQAPTQQSSTSLAEDQLADFTSVVLADTEDTWNQIFQEQIGQDYPEPTLVLYSGSTQSACGLGQAAMGPFYCPADQQVYIDLSFYNDLKSRHQAPGDFAQAYVIAHEVGHHVQNVLGISRQVRQLQSRANKAEANQLSVRLELQADCFAGVWANRADRARDILESGDIEEALNAASQIGDDRLQQQSQGFVVPESFTHGSSAQRVRWFKQGLATGDIEQCNTFVTNQI